MKKSIDVEQLLYEILYSSDLKEKIQELKFKINEIKSGRLRNTKESINDLELSLNHYERNLHKYSQMRTEIHSLKSEFQFLNRKYIIMDQFQSIISGISMLQYTKVRKEIYNEMTKLRDERRKNADKIEKVLQDNLGVIIKANGASIGYILKKNGYTKEEISYELQRQMEDAIKNNTSSLGIDEEKKQECNDIKKTIVMKRLSRRSSDLTLPTKIYSINVPNYRIEKIFSDVYQRLEKILYLHQEHKLSIDEENYYTIVNQYIYIIDLYQDIQWIMSIKEAFKNTIANQFFEGLDKEIANAYKEIERNYERLNKYIGKLGEDNILGPIVDIVNEVKNEVVQTINDVKEDIVNRPEENKLEENIVKKEKTEQDIDVISIIDSYKKRIAEAKKSVDNHLLVQTKIYYQETYDAKRGYVAAYGDTFYKFLKSFYSDSEEMKPIIEYERLKDELAGYVYEFWKQSGSEMNFGDYAKFVQGVEIDSPSSYVENDISIINKPIKVESYVQTKENNIKAAKERYRKKSALWKAMNKKLNPEYMNFDNMSNEEINNLYGGKRR